MKKTIEIENCYNCPHCEYHYDECDEEWWIIKCGKLKKETFEDNIPEWCPLPNAE